MFTVRDLKLQTTTSGTCVTAQKLGYVQLINVVFGAAATYHCYALGGGSIVFGGNYSIVGGASIHWSTAYHGTITAQGRTITLTGTPAFSTAFAYGNGVSVIACGGNTFSGAATGVRYQSIANALIDTNGGGASYLPGNSAGTTLTGGQYV